MNERQQVQLRIALGLSAIALALVAAVFRSWLALPALVAVVVGTAMQRGTNRWLVGLAGGVLTTAALVRFTLEWAAPSIVLAGQDASERRAVSHLREILWAEDRVLENKFADTN